MFSTFSLKDDQEYTYHGDRTREEIVKFALRLSGPPVQEITKPESFNTIKKDRDLYFLYVGDRSGVLWVIYFNFINCYESRLKSLKMIRLLNHCLTGTLSQDCNYISSARVFLSISSKRCK